MLSIRRKYQVYLIHSAPSGSSILIFPVMMCGGISALLMQMLHPFALAGIWVHSNCREDIFGRLPRTSQFILTTTFGTA